MENNIFDLPNKANAKVEIYKIPLYAMPQSVKLRMLWSIIRSLCGVHNEVVIIKEKS